MRLPVWPFTLAALAIVASTASGKGKKMSSGNSNAHKTLLWDKLRSIHQLTEMQRMFVMLVAYGETGKTYKATAHNDTPSEVQASENAWDNNPSLANKLRATGYPRAAWCIGSGGYGGRLVPYFGDDMSDAGLQAYMAPANVFVPNTSLVSTLITCRKLQEYKSYENNPTVGTLRVGLWGPAAMANPPLERIEKYRRHAVGVGGIDGSFVDKTLTLFPDISEAKSILAQLQQGT